MPASASSRFGASFSLLRREHLRDCLGHRPLALARLGAAGKPVERGPRFGRIDADRSRRRPLARFVPLLQPREEHSLAALGPIEPRPDQRRPSPADPVQRRVRGPRPFALAPVAVGEHGQQRSAISPSAAAASASLAGGSSPTARLSPATVGTANLAGWMKANSSSRSSPLKSG